MPDADNGSAGTDLQFDRVVTESTSLLSDSAAAVCAACHTSIHTEYYQINGNTVCTSCRHAVEAATQTPRGVGTLVKAGVFGLGAGIVGAAIYYAVIAIANLEIGIVAILIGYMVGYAVRKGAGNRGGRRFQVLAVALTYGSVALAYMPLAIRGAIEEERKAQTAAVSGASAVKEPVVPAESGVGDDDVSAGDTIVALAFLLGFMAALPLIVVFGSLPSGLISAAIIFFGMQQAWAMTRAPTLVVYGPYRVGGDPSSSVSA